jgi:hypothetical protein
MSVIFHLEAVFTIGPHTILTGTIKEGVLKPKMKFNLDKKVLEVEKIESYGKALASAISGSKIGISFTNLSSSDLSSLKPLIRKDIAFY